MAKVLIEYEGNLGNLKAQLAEVEQANQSISDSAKQTAQQVGDEYRKVASTAAKAFAGQEVSKALQDQEKNVDALTQSLNDLLQQELKLLAANKQGTKEFASLQDQLKKTREEFDRQNGAQDKFNKQIPKTAAEIGKLEDRLRELAIAGQQGTQEFDDIARAIGEYKAAITTADRAVDLYAKSTDAATGRLRELEDKLYDLALAGQTNTQEFKDTIAQVTNLKRAVFEVDQQVDSYLERSRGFATVVQNVELIGNAFQIVEGAAALFGEENEELQKTLVRLNAILAITQGLEQARTILLEQNAKKTGIVAIAQKAYTTAISTSTGALKSFGLALSATGIAGLAIALGGLVFLFDSLNKSVGRNAPLLAAASERLKELQKEAEDATIRLKLLRGEITNTDAQRLKAQAAFIEQLSKDLTPLLAEQIRLERDIILNKKTIATLEEIGDTAGVQRLQERIKLQEQEQKQNQEAIDSLIKASRERQAQELTIINLQKEKEDADKNLTKSATENTKAVEEQAKAYEQLAIAASDVTSRLIASDKAIQEATTNILIQTREKQLSQLRVLAEQGLATREQIAEAEIKLILANERAQREAVENRLKQSLEGVKAGSLEEVKVKESAKAEIENIEQQSAEAIFNINKALADNIKSEEEKLKEVRQKQLEELTKQVFQYVNAIGSAFSAIVDLQNELSERRIEQIETLRDKELEANAVLQQSYADRVRNDEAITLRANRKIVEEKRKQARLDKALGIFNATIDTAKAIVGFLSDPGGVAGIILSVAAGVTGATQIAKISSEPLPSFGKGGWIDGEPHTRGGVDINAEGGEFVTRKSQAGTFRRELEAMNTSRAAFLKVIEESYVRPRLAQLSNDRSVNVNVNARLNSSGMESRLDTLTKETRKTRRVFTQAMAHSHSQRYSW